LKGVTLKAVLVILFLVSAAKAECLAGVQAEDVKNQAINALNSRDYGSAIRILEPASSSNPFDDELKRLLGFAYDGKGWELSGREQFEPAVECFQKARLVEPKKEEATYLGLGYAFFRLKNSDDALYYLNEAVDVDPNAEQAHELLGQINYDRGKLQEALREWGLALEIKPENNDVKASIARAKKELGVEGSFTKRETYYFNVRYEGEEKRELGDEVLNILYGASTNVGGELGYYLKEPVNVILYTRKQFVDITDAPSWSGGIFDGNIRIPVGGGHIDQNALSAILHHEFTHAVLHTIAGNKIPTWLDEGIAQYEERWAREPEGDLTGGEVVPLSSLSGSFMGMGDSGKVRQAYAESLSAVRFYVDRYGMYSLSRLVKLLGEGRGLSDAMVEAAGVSLVDFEGLWRNSLGM